MNGEQKSDGPVPRKKIPALVEIDVAIVINVQEYRDAAGGAK